MLLGCSTEESKQALTSVGLGWTGCSCQGVHMSQNLLFHLGQIPVGSLGWSLAFCWISMDPHRAEEGPGHDLRGDEMEQEWLLFVTKP